MVVGEYRQMVRSLCEAERPFHEIEDAIERTPLPREQKSALWLYAWSYPNSPHGITQEMLERLT
jgi:hypothetical protein